MSSFFESCCSCIPQRWVVVLISSFGLFNAISMRICLSMAITRMVVPINNTVEYADDTCPDYNNHNTSQHDNLTLKDENLFEWSEYTQGVILSSFYWTYVFTNILGGVIAEKFGGKYTLGLGILATSILTLLTPASIEWGGSSALIVVRALMGLGEGATYPALNVLLAQWIPKSERSTASSLIFAGGPLGNVFGVAISGLILHHSNIGWPAVFYFFGTIGVLSFVLNTALCYSKPTDHPFISEAELKYLKQNLETDVNLPPTPWRHILTSRPMWALMAINIGNAWGFITIVTDMPKYMSSVLKFSVKSNGYASSMPYLCMWFVGFVASYFADYLIRSKRMSTVLVRKIGCSVASIGPGVFIVAVSYAGCNGALAVALLTIALSLKGFSYCSTMVNALDLAPNYVGSLMGLVNGVSTTSGILSPYIAGVLTPNQTISEWRLVFWMIFVIFVIANTMFLAFGSGELEEWNDPEFLTKKKSLAKSDIEDVKAAVQLLSTKEQLT